MAAQSINVESIALYSIRIGISDSISFTYDDTKIDESGEFVKEKIVMLILMKLSIVLSISFDAT